MDIVTLSHVVEPPLCGLGARYLDLGGCYDLDHMERNREALLLAKRRNADCYPLCYAALRCAAEAAFGLHKIVSAAQPEGMLRELEDLLPPLPKENPPGPVFRCYLSGITPKGLLFLPPKLETLYILQDSYGLSAALLEQWSRSFRAAGLFCVTAYDPLSPTMLQALLIPELQLGYVRASKLFPVLCASAGRIDLDGPVLRSLSYASGTQLEAFEVLLDRAIQQALSQLREAKRCHDELEAACRPAVDFQLVDRITDSVLEKLQRRLSS